MGVVVDRVGDPYQMGILAGIAEASKAANVGLLCFVGGVIPTDPNGDASHRIFDLVGTQNVDGVILLTATLMHQLGRSGIETYCESHFGGLPRCSIGVELKGVSSVTSNNSRAIYDIVSHLVKEHGYQRIAFVRGPLANVEADQRYQAYASAIRDNGLLLDERLVAVGDFLQASGFQALRTFEQIPGLLLNDLDAIVASNDCMAVGVLTALEELGIPVPTSIAVTGFDDIEDAHLTAVPLTTARQPLERIGREATRSVLKSIQSGNAIENLVIDTELVLRRSCGCGRDPTQVKHSAAPELNHGFEASLIVRRQHILETLTRTARGELGVAGQDWQAKLLTAFVLEMRGEKPGAFRCMVEEIARKLTERGTESQVCHDVIDVMRRQVAVTLRCESARRDKAEAIFYATHLALSELQQRDVSRDRLRLGRWGRDVSEACNSIFRAFDRTELRTQIVRQLPTIGLKNFYVALYPDEKRLDRAELFAAVDNGQETALANPGIFETCRLLPPELQGFFNSGRAFVVLPLSVRSISLGHIAIELNRKSLFCYDVVAQAIASGVFAARLAEKDCQLSLGDKASAGL